MQAVYIIRLNIIISIKIYIYVIGTIKKKYIQYLYKDKPVEGYLKCVKTSLYL